jgi:hypothetical protein
VIEKVCRGRFTVCNVNDVMVFLLLLMCISIALCDRNTGSLIVSGDFMIADTPLAGLIAYSYATKQWSTVGGGFLTCKQGQFYAVEARVLLETSPNVLLIAGDIRGAAQGHATDVLSNIGAWNASSGTWDTMGGGVDSTVENALVSPQQFLSLHGYFSSSVKGAKLPRGLAMYSNGTVSLIVTILINRIIHHCQW